MRRFTEFISKDTTQKDVIECLYLKAILDSYHRIKSIPGRQTFTEYQIRNKIVYDLENNNEFLKYWIDEKIIQLTSESQIIKEEELYRTDIVFFVSLLGSFVIECKRLRSAEQRYLDDGVRRFVDLEYAQKDQFGCMIGFVVGGNILLINSKLASKVREYWYDKNFEHLLSIKCANWDTSFQSKHIRKDSSPIHIYHLFFSFV